MELPKPRSYLACRRVKVVDLLPDGTPDPDGGEQFGVLCSDDTECLFAGGFNKIEDLNKAIEESESIVGFVGWGDIYSPVEGEFDCENYYGDAWFED